MLQFFQIGRLILAFLSRLMSSSKFLYLTIQQQKEVQQILSLPNKKSLVQNVDDGFHLSSKL